MCQHFISNPTHRWAGRVPNEIHRGNLWSKCCWFSVRLFGASCRLPRRGRVRDDGLCDSLRPLPLLLRPLNPDLRRYARPQHRCLLQRGFTSIMSSTSYYVVHSCFEWSRAVMSIFFPYKLVVLIIHTVSKVYRYFSSRTSTLNHCWPLGCY